MLKSVDLKKCQISTLVIPVCEDQKIHNIKSIISLIELGKEKQEFQGKKDEKIVLYNPPNIKAERVVFMGLGKLSQIDLEKLRIFAGNAVKYCVKAGLKEVLIAAPLAKALPLETENRLTALFEGAFLGNHIFDKYKKEKKAPLKKIEVLAGAGTAKKYNKLSHQIEIICKGTVLAREWVSTPSNDKKPAVFANGIISLAKTAGLKTTLLDEKFLQVNKFGGILAVAAGSNARPRMVILEYKAGNAEKTVALVGKGVTFDSGGINLKSADGLTGMKMDMSGAATVAGAMIALAKLKPKINIIGVMPLVENMPSGKAIRPGDIIKTWAGQSVEIGNTDAEGRLILADALAYVIKEYKPQAVIDLATLTGACVVALGEKIAGVFGSDNNLTDLIIKSGKKTHERCWPMPMPDDYKELLKSDFADLCNMSSSRWGGAITAALFLADFVKNTPWAHIDIAGPAYIKKSDAYCEPGGTGFGVRLLCDLIQKMQGI